MSSTNRGGIREVSDYYVTPIEDIHLFLNNFLKEELLDTARLILDPCAGGYGNTLMSYPEALKQIGFNNILTVDIREDSLADIKGDYLNIDYLPGPFMIITNPPFSLALEIIKKSLNDVVKGGFVIMLQRVNFLGSKKRFSFLSNNMPKYVFVHHKRISFTNKDGKSGTDSIEYAHFVWQKGWKGGTKLFLI